MNKILVFLKAQFTLTISEITLLGIFIVLWMVCNTFVKIPVPWGFLTITYCFPILFGLIFKPFPGVIGAVIADTLSMAVAPAGFSQWMWEYAIIYPSIVLIISSLKVLLKKDNKNIWWIISLITTITVISSAVIVFSLNTQFRPRGGAKGDIFDLTKSILFPLSIIAMSLFIIYEIVIWILYLRRKSEKIREIIIISSMVMLVLALIVWLWGPFAFMEYRIAWLHADRDATYSQYSFYVIPRIIETSILAPLYTSIVIPIYRLCDYFVHHNTKNKW